MTETAPEPPFRAEHVGSLLRPPELTGGYRALRDGSLDPDAYRDLQDRAIRDAVALQEEVGLESITDGEFRRASYWARFVEAVDGLGIGPAAFSFHDEAGEELPFLAPRVEGRIRRRESISGDEFAFLAATTNRTPKITLPSPSTMHFWGGAGAFSPGSYDDLDEFFSDLGEVYRAEISALAAAGARYIQIDEVPIAMLCDPDVRDRVSASGLAPDELVTRYVGAINSALEGRPDTMTVGMHLCRGNFKGKWLSEGGYGPVAARLFNETAVDAFFLEYDSERSGGFAPLREVPPDRTVVLGLVTTKRPELERPDDLRRRIEEASRFAPLDRLALSPQCGFSSAVSGNPVTIEDERAKLRLVVEVAADVWG